MRKKIIPFLLTLLCLFTPTAASAVELQVDNRPLVADTEAVIIGGRTFVPMRAVLEALGAKITWDATEKKVTAEKGDHVVVLWLNQKTAYVDGISYELPESPVSINERILIPARFVSEKLGCSVFWDKEADTVFIFTEDAFANAYRAKKEREKALPSSIPQQIVPSPAPQQTPPPAALQEAPKSRQVYITRTGKRYHYDNHCNGGTYFPSTLQQALAKGLTPCKKCVG